MNPSDPDDDNSVEVSPTATAGENFPFAVSAVRAAASKPNTDSNSPLANSGATGAPAEQVVATKAICDGAFALEHLESVHTIAKTTDRTGVDFPNSRDAAAAHLECARDYIQKTIGALKHSGDISGSHPEANEGLSQDFIAAHQRFTQVQSELGDLIRRQPGPDETDTSSSIAESLNTSEEGDFDLEGVANWEETMADPTDDNTPPIPTVEDLQSVATIIAEAVGTLNVGLGEEYHHIINSPEEKPTPVGPAAESAGEAPTSVGSSTEGRSDTMSADHHSSDSVSEYIPTNASPLLTTSQ